MIKVKDLYHSKGTIDLLNGINLEIKKGETIIITGHEREGKTLLLQCLLGLETFRKGKIIYNEETLPGREQDIGIVQQYFNLFPHKTIMENVIEVAIILHKVKRETAEDYGRNILKKLGLIEKADLYPEVLDRGDKKLVALAKALVRKPKLLLIDEPVSQLEEDCRHKVYRAIQQLATDGLTLVIVTEDFYFSNLLDERTFMLDNGVIKKYIREGEKDGAH